MKTTAIICEFNPLHSGHKRLIDYAKTFSDKIICIMSGNFTQRGMPACCDKYSRAKHALLAGADLVVELPTIFATASAENFAYGGVAIANKLKADYLLFGSECGDIDELTSCAKLLMNKDVNSQIAKEIKKGVSYPKAIAIATQLTTLEKPNNTLAIEYIKALINSQSTITPITIKREDNFNSKPNQYASSNALRAQINLRAAYSYEYVTNDINDSIEEKFKSVATSLIAIKTCGEMKGIEGVSEGIENRIFAANKSQGYDKMIEEIKTKRYTRLRLQRIILNAVLNVSKSDVQSAKKCEIAVTPLAVKSDSVKLLANTNDKIDELTYRADRLYHSMSEATPPQKLIKLN